MPAANFCRDCGAGVELDNGMSDASPGPVGYRPSTITTAGDAIPGELAEMGTRAGAWAITNVIVQVIGWIPGIGPIISLAAFIWTLVLYRRGLDIGARLTGIRVVRDTGELAGFFQMWARAVLSLVSLVLVGAGYWTAYSEPDKRTWHDTWLRTYVVKDSPELEQLPGTSSNIAQVIFWASLVAGAFLLYLFTQVFGITTEELAGP